MNEFIRLTIIVLTFSNLDEILKLYVLKGSLD